jgi:Fe-S oxidoreductase
MIDLSKTYFGLPAYSLFWVFFAVAAFIFSKRVCFLVKSVLRGKPENRFDHMGGRIAGALAETLLQWCNLKNVTLRDKAGVGHAVLFWGFCLFSVYYAVFIGLGSGLGFSGMLSDTSFETIYSAIVNIAAVLIMAALVWAAFRRYLARPERLEGADNMEAGVILFLIFCLMVLHLTVEVLHDTAGPALEAVWWAHYLLLLGFMVFIPYSKHLHILASPANIIFRKKSAKGALRDIDIAQPENYRLLFVEDFTWKQLLDGFSCTVCGRCHEVCPARRSGKSLSPREVVLGIKECLLKDPAGRKTVESGKGEPAGLVGNLIAEDAVWACTTCGACQEVCPVSNEQMNAIVDFRRHLQMGALTTTGQEILKNLRVRMHPWRGTLHARSDWADEMDVKIVGEDDDIDILFWVGCTGALEDRCRKVTQSVASVMQASGVNFGVLAEEELCCGDPARRMGGEHLFQMLAAGNIQLLKDYGIRKIVTACPHCYNTLKNEYPRFGGGFEVIHHTELVSGLIREKKIKPPPGEKISVTYHDPCYLGRHNGNYHAAREIMENMPGLKLTEMADNRKDSLCCGGGGGRLWLEEDIGRRISDMRFEQAVETKAEVIVTACPYCLQMFESESGGREGDGRIEVKDVAELLADSMQKKA